MINACDEGGTGGGLPAASKHATKLGDVPAPGQALFLWCCLASTVLPLLTSACAPLPSLLFRLLLHGHSVDPHCRPIQLLSQRNGTQQPQRSSTGTHAGSLSSCSECGHGRWTCSPAHQQEACAGGQPRGPFSEPPEQTGEATALPDCCARASQCQGGHGRQVPSRSTSPGMKATCAHASHPPSALPSGHPPLSVHSRVFG